MLQQCFPRTCDVRDRKQTSRADQCECEKGSDRPPTDMKAGREDPVSGREEVTGRMGYSSVSPLRAFFPSRVSVHLPLVSLISFARLRLSMHRLALILFGSPLCSFQ